MEAFSGVAALSPPQGCEVRPAGGSYDVPDVVLLRVTPRQMMEISDAVEIDWSESPNARSFPRRRTMA